MTRIHSSTYNSEFPECFTWGDVKSPQLCSLAIILSVRIQRSLRTGKSLNELPGLRAALREIANKVRL